MGGTPSTERPLRIRAVLRQCASTYRGSWRDLVVAGLILFVPIGLISSLGPADGFEVESVDGRILLTLVALILLQVVVPLLGTVFYSGVVAAAVMAHREGPGHGLREVAWSLPYGRLVLADLTLVAITALGLVLLIIPGLVFLVWFSLVAPAVEVERTNVRSGLARSRRLVRGRFWTVAALVWTATILQSALESAGDEAAFGLLGEGWASDWVGSVAGNLLAAPIFALVVVILYLDLKGDRSA